MQFDYKGLLIDFEHWLWYIICYHTEALYMKGEINLSEVRKDSKGRKLMTGESQDKDGRYRYKYCDAFGNRKSVYSWRLTESDSYPKGKRKDISLRERKEHSKGIKRGH